MRILKAFLYGNWFYGVCAAALSVEAALQQHWPLNGWMYHAVVLLGTVVFYTHAYRGVRSATSSDERTRWYADHHRALTIAQAMCIALMIVLAVAEVGRYADPLAGITRWHACLFLLFPAVGLAYYGTVERNLRRIGWSKPFVIGFVWAGVVTVYPVLFRSAMEHAPFPFTLIGTLLFLKNFMFISMLGILFDIKDAATDSHHALDTFVVKHGLRRTIHRLVVPLTALGLGTFLLYGSTHGFSAMKILLNTVPFVLLFLVAFSLRRRRTVLYYLTVVDGLMLVKALCGSAAMVFF